MVVRRVPLRQELLLADGLASDIIRYCERQRNLDNVVVVRKLESAYFERQLFDCKGKLVSLVFVKHQVLLDLLVAFY